MKKLVLILVVIFSVMLYIVPLFSDDTSVAIKELVLTECDELQQDNDRERLTTRNWRDFVNTSYCVNYLTTESDYTSSYEYRANYVDNYTTDFNLFWGQLYKNLYTQDRELLKPLMDSLIQTADSDINRSDFADLIVSFVQDIPYSYVIEGQRGADEEGEYDCVEYEKWGILSPVEFLHTLSGDCDTRTVLLYSILKGFGYNPKIAISRVYLHSMILLDVPGTGAYAEIGGERFYFWETTSKNWKPGDMPPSMSNTSNWDIVL